MEGELFATTGLCVTVSFRSAFSRSTQSYKNVDNVDTRFKKYRSD